MRLATKKSLYSELGAEGEEEGGRVSYSSISSVGAETRLRLARFAMDSLIWTRAQAISLPTASNSTLDWDYQGPASPNKQHVAKSSLQRFASIANYGSVDTGTLWSKTREE